MVTATRLNKTELKRELRHILERHIGRDSAITGESLARRFGCRSTKPIRELFWELIDEGFPIASTSKPPYGYFIPESCDEAKENTEYLREMAKLLFLRCRKVRRNTALYRGPDRQGRLL